jgi:hypothetical protein
MSKVKIKICTCKVPSTVDPEILPRVRHHSHTLQKFWWFFMLPTVYPNQLLKKCSSLVLHRSLLCNTSKKQVVKLCMMNS